MMALIDEYRTELSAVCVFSEDTVQTYVSCIVRVSCSPAIAQREESASLSSRRDSTLAS